MIRLTMNFTPSEYEAFCRALERFENIAGAQMTMESLFNFLIAKFNGKQEEKCQSNHHAIRYYHPERKRYFVHSISGFNDCFRSAN